MPFDVATLLPRRDHSGWVSESESEYLARVDGLVPNIPSDALVQCFYDHDTQVHSHYDWLDFSTIRFAPASLGTSYLLSAELGKAELLDSRYDYISSTEKLPDRWTRLRDYMVREGTWPRPVILLDNPEGSFRGPYYVCGKPHELMEGHNRVAMLRALHRLGFPLKSEHAVWLVRPQDPTGNPRPAS